ncbi:CENP-B N-terminal DNA-binding domain [Popillia japonica]|uniref:CENP-B N-terminal DNA-binding domain n=1 Tax=Popillia japonica TaxID=7064 RepID=A0AAW1KMH4_POPJA
MSKRKCLNIHDKLKVLESIDKDCKKKDVAKKFGIPPSSLSTIIKNRDLILKSSDNAGRETKRVKMCVFEDVDQAVLKWHCFSKAWFCEVAVNWDREDELPLSELRNFWRCLETSGNFDSNITLEDYLGVDEHIVTTEYPSDDDILKSVTSNSEIAADDDDEEDDSDEPVRKPTNEDK